MGYESLKFGKCHKINTLEFGVQTMRISSTLGAWMLGHHPKRLEVLFLNLSRWKGLGSLKLGGCEVMIMSSGQKCFSGPVAKNDTESSRRFTRGRKAASL